MISIRDPDLPGLSDLGPETLNRIAGRENVSLLRLRYRAGDRAILHLSSNEGDGAAWFFRGDKARRLARSSTATARYDEATGAVFEPFPHDHRMPQIRAFLEEYQGFAPDLIGGRPAGPPHLLRYRPGLSCTFRCTDATGCRTYVKLINDQDPLRLAEMNRQMVADLSDGPVKIAPIIGTAPAYAALAYGAADGHALDTSLARAASPEATGQVLDALRRFWAMRLTPARQLTARGLLDRGLEGVTLASVTVPGMAAPLARLHARLEARVPRIAQRPIHADMKLEHVFLGAGHTTLIDTESVSLGPPDYDLAQLYGRLWQAELDGLLPTAHVRAAADEVRHAGGRSFDWCLGIVALRLARFYAQRPTSEAADKITGILERLS